jgi:Fe-Mn family superoxide dismutase
MTHPTRREALRAAAASAATLALAPLHARAEDAKKPAGYTLPPLDYGYDKLMPYIDTLTMKIHHDKHHAAYIKNANALLASHPKLLAMPVDELLANIDMVPKTIRTGVINNAGGHANHSLFWKVMAPKAGGEPKGALAKEIDKYFGSFDKFQDKFSKAAAGQFGSGWAWLVVNKKGEMEVIGLPNQNSPLLTGHKPLLGLDVWEHAYYLKYQNQRPAYVKAWWNVVNWADVSERAAKAAKA